MDLVGCQAERVEHGLASSDNSADEGDDPLGLAGGAAGVAQERGIPAAHFDRLEQVDRLPLSPELLLRTPDGGVPEDVPARRHGSLRQKAKLGKPIVDDEFLVAHVRFLEGRKDPVDDPSLPLDALQLPNPDAFPTCVAEDEFRYADLLVLGQ